MCIETLEGEKYFCHHCKKMLEHYKYNRTKREGAYIKRNGHLPICISCNKDLGVIKKAVNDGMEKTLSEIERYERIIHLKHMAVEKMTEKEEGGY